MTFLYENPVAIVGCGALLTAALVAGWWKVQDSRLLTGAIVAALITIGLLALERIQVTDREQIEKVIYGIATEVEQGHMDGAVGFVHPDALETKQQALTELRLVRVSQITVKRPIRVEFASSKSPTRATAQFNVVVTGSDATGMVGDRRVPRFVEVQFSKDQGRWWVESYEHFDPLHGMRSGPMP